MRQRLMFAALVAAAACGGSGSNAVTLSARLGSSAGGSTAPASGIELGRVRIAVRNLRVEAKESQKDVEISAGPLLLDATGAALSGALLQLVQAGVPAGTYDKLKVEVRPLGVSPSAAFDDLVQRGASVLVEGTIDGQSFTFSSALEAELEHEGQFELGASSANITLSLDSSKWFQAADGSRLDPRTVANQGTIEANIRRSFSAFEDDDEDGVEDHGHDDAGGDDLGQHDGGDDGQAGAGVDNGQHDGGSGHG